MTVEPESPYPFRFRNHAKYTSNPAGVQAPSSLHYHFRSSLQGAKIFLARHSPLVTRHSRSLWLRPPAALCHANRFPLSLKKIVAGGRYGNCGVGAPESVVGFPPFPNS
jgi:hypothetical protein